MREQTFQGLKLLLLTHILAIFGLSTMKYGAGSDAKLLKAGAAVVNINPATLPVQSNGSMTPRLADSIHDDLYARCLVLDNGQVKIALVVCDSCMIPRELFDKSKLLAFDQTGIPVENILCSATHTHSAVSVASVFQSEVESDYSELLAQRIADGIALAVSRLETARIGWAIGSAPQHVFNRRWHLRPDVVNVDPFGLGHDRVRMNPPPNHRDLLRPAGPTDPEIPVLAVQSADGHPIAIWTNYSLHYVGGVPGNVLSADYFGEYAKQWELLLRSEAKNIPQNRSAVIAMTNGTSGDINNVNFYEGNQLQQPFEQIRLVASEIARAAFVAYQRIDFQDWIPLAVRHEEVELGVRKPTPSELSDARNLLGESGSPPWKTPPAIYAKETADLAEFPDTVTLILQTIRIGDLGIAAIPCETFVETGLFLKAQSPLQPMFTVELANGYNGYLPTPQQHALGGYETWRAKSSYLAVDAEPRIVSTLLRLLNDLATEAMPAKLQQGDPVPAAPPSSSIDPGNVRKPSNDALSAIESTRGGRHWVDMPTPPPKSAQESLACFQVEPGVRIELVACEPLVLDPVWIAFDEMGRMFVAEYADYPNGPGEDSPAGLSRIVMLEDRDHDGMMDRRQVFADHLDFCHSMMPFRGGYLVCTPDAILYLKDTDGDNQADLREVLFSGFRSPHPQMQIGCPQWGADNWIAFTYGSGKVLRAPEALLQRLFGVAQGTSEKDTSLEVGTIPTLQGQSLQDIANQDFRFHPLTFDFGPVSGFGQYGNTLDRWGHRLFCTNRNPIIAAPVEYSLLRRNPNWIATEDRYDVAPSGQQSVVYPRVNMKSNYLSHAGSYTAACGTTAYTGSLLGAAFEDSVFVCEPVGHLVTRYVVEPQGSQLVAHRAREKEEFLASSDSWFRPSSLANGPDGALYLADMARLWVEHPKFLPPDVAAKLDWRAGEDMGRIWRIVPVDHRQKPDPFQLADSASGLVAMLAHANGWQRQLAQRLIVERQMEAVAPALRELIQHDSMAQTVHSALSTLSGLHCLTAEDVLLALDSDNARVRETAVRLAEEFLGDERVLQKVACLAEDADGLVRFQVALTLGASSHSWSTAALAKVAIADHDQYWTGTAVLCSSRDRSAEILLAMGNSLKGADSPPSLNTDRLVRQLAECIGAEGSISQLQQLSGMIAQPDSSLDWWNLRILLGLAAGFPRYQGEIGTLNLQTLLDVPPDPLQELASTVGRLVRGLPALAFNRGAALAERVAAIELLSYIPHQATEISMEPLLDSSQPGDVQLAALKSIKRLAGSTWATRVVHGWSNLGPNVRQAALSILLADSHNTKTVLESMAEGQFDSAIFSIDQRAMLLAHPNAEIRELAKKVMGSSISPDREAILQQYRSAIDLPGSFERGQAVFDRVCAACHRLSDRGKPVGPDLSDSRSRTRESLLMDILDPNHRIDPQYMLYQVLTHDGHVFQGLLTTESSEAIVLKLPGGEEQTLFRSEIEKLTAAGNSLMPEGVEKEVTLQQMADLLEFLQPAG